MQEGGKKKLNITIFASGNGTNAQKIIDHFRNSETAQIGAIFTNNVHAYVIERAKHAQVPCFVVDPDVVRDGEAMNSLLDEAATDLLVLAGYMKLIPEAVVDEYRGKILNVHPALLPAYGGKGMYGSRVHEAVIAAGEPESGITVHYVDEVYDRGDVIFQEKIKIRPGWGAKDLENEIKALEHTVYPVIIEKICRELQEQSVP